MGVITRRRAPSVPLLPAAPAAGVTVVEVRGAGCVLGGHRVLHDVDLDVRAGEVLVVVGPNGAGKSTLVSLLAGDRVPNAGSVTIDGRASGAWAPRELARRRSVLLQRAELAFPFTVAQVVAMGRAPWAATPREDDDERAVARALRATDTGAFVDRVFPSLSGGEQARVQLARVLAQETAMLLLDEPTAALDLRHQEQVAAIARGRARAGAAVVVVAHDLALAARTADRIAVVAEGTLRAVGPPGDVVTAELLSAVYQHPIDVVRHPATGTLLVVPTPVTAEEAS